MAGGKHHCRLSQEYAGPTEDPVDEANLYIPFGVAVHQSGDIYISGFDHCIRRISDGQVSNVAGLCQNYSNTGIDDGPAPNARFDTPLDIRFLGDDELIIADSYNDRIRVFDVAQRNVDTIAGSDAGYLDGTALDALFDVPRSIAVDYAGNIYGADSVNMRIRSSQANSLHQSDASKVTSVANQDEHVKDADLIEPIGVYHVTKTNRSFWYSTVWKTRNWKLSRRTEKLGWDAR